MSQASSRQEQELVLGFTLAHGDASTPGCAFELTKRAYVIVRPANSKPTVKEIGHALLGQDGHAYTQFSGWTDDLRAIITVAKLTVPSCDGRNDYPFSSSKYLCSLGQNQCKKFLEGDSTLFQVTGAPKDFFGFSFTDSHLYRFPNGKSPIQLHGVSTGHGADVNPVHPTIYDVENISCDNPLMGHLPCDISCQGQASTCLFVREDQSKTWLSTCGRYKHVYGHWSPDGRKLVYAWNSDDDPYQLGIVRFDVKSFRKNACGLEGTPLSETKDVAATFPHNSSLMAWSPHSNWVYFSGFANKEIFRVAVGKTASSAAYKTEQITDFKRDGMHEKAYPSVSPKGTYVAYTGIKDGVRDLAIIRLSDRNVTHPIPSDTLGKDGFVLYPLWRIAGNH